jgi:hypothetical protein
MPVLLSIVLLHIEGSANIPIYQLLSKGQHHSLIEALPVFPVIAMGRDFTANL